MSALEIGKFEVRDEKAEKRLQQIGDTLRGLMPEGYGFALLMFTWKEGGLFYTSNGNRTDMIKAMREFIAKFEEN